MFVAVSLRIPTHILLSHLRSGRQKDSIFCEGDKCTVQMKKRRNISLRAIIDINARKSK